MNLTFITEHYPPDPGGVATSSKRVAEALVVAGHRVQVLTFDNTRPLVSEDYADRLTENGVSICRVGPFFLRHPDLAKLSLSEKLRAVFRRRACNQMIREAVAFRPDAVLSFYLLNAGFLSRFVASELSVPCFVSVRGNDIGLNIFHVERFAAVRWTLEGAAGVLCVNEHLRRRALLMAPELRDRIAVIPNGVAIYDPSLLRQQSRARIAAATSWAASSHVAVFIGTLREKKGVVTLLSALELAVKQAPIKLLVVGPPIGNVERHLCEPTWDRMISDGHLFCTGQLSRDAVPQWAAGCDSVLMPSLDDGLANGLLEGMAMGLCPVASHVFKDVIRSQETGFLFDANSPHELSRILKTLTEQPTSTEAKGQAARDHVTTHHRPDMEAEHYVMAISAAVTSRTPS